MEFYQLLGKYYDDLFPANPEEMKFYSSLLGDSPNFLDIGCGTGNKTVLLAENRTAVAFDSDETMVEQARQRHPGEKIRFLQLDMREMEKSFSPRSFAAAVCLGNTLPHLSRQGELMHFMHQVGTVLVPGGVYVGQILNYDRIIDQQVTELPVIETPAVIFRRMYEWHDGQLAFIASVTDKATGEERRENVFLRPFLKAAVESTLSSAGFGVVDYYGNAKGEPYGPDSYHLIFRTTLNT